MSKHFKPTIKHDFVTSTYIVRDSKGNIVSVPEVIIDSLSDAYKKDIDELQEDIKHHEYVKASVLNDREEYKNQNIKLNEYINEQEKKSKAFDTFIKYKQHVDKYGKQGGNELEKVFESVMREYMEEGE